jgi:hypothetical protein
MAATLRGGDSEAAGHQIRSPDALASSTAFTPFAHQAYPGRRPAGVSAIIMTLLLAVAACGGGHPNLPSRHPAQSAGPSIQTTAETPMQPTRKQSGSLLSPRQLYCQHGFPVSPPGQRSDDLVIGPVRYPGLRHGYSAYLEPLTTPNYPGGGYYYKVGTELAPGATATVEIDSSASDYAALLSMYSPQAGDQAITYHSCAESEHGTFWVGGFILHGRSTACVPLRITVAGESTVHRVVVALPAGACS